MNFALRSEGRYNFGLLWHISGAVYFALMVDASLDLNPGFSGSEPNSRRLVLLVFRKVLRYLVVLRESDLEYGISNTFPIMR